MPRMPISLVAAALALTACAAREPTSPQVGLTKPFEPHKPASLGHFPPRTTIEVYHVYVADTIRNSCSGSLPFFEFDSTKMKPEEQADMHRLAVCMKTGALRDKRVQLVGRADPRGSEEYNEKLGLERAERVKSYLVGQGVDAGRVLTKSSGEKNASSSPEDWSKDRHVEVNLVP